LEFGFYLELGAWDLELGIWYFLFGSWCLEFGIFIPIYHGDIIRVTIWLAQNSKTYFRF
jgi:hypothetical protein